MSDKVKSTEQDRLERMAALLSGSRSQDRVGRALGQGGSYSNVLLGAMLHGADRVRQGKTPTDLERPLLDALGAVVSDAELRQLGRMYRDLVAGQGRLARVPETITRLSVDQGYSLADLRRDMPHVVADALASPNVQIVDPFAAAAGAPEDPAFVTAMRDTGVAVTAYEQPPRPAAVAAAEDGTGQAQDAPAGQEQDGSALATFQVRLELESFYVARTVGDQWGGDDEIYWAASTGTGASGQAGTAYLSEEFKNGSADQGKTPRFAAGRNVLFEGRSGGWLGTSIQVWEADQSDEEWWAEFKRRLDLAVFIIDTFMQIGDLGLGKIPTWAGIAWEVAKIFVSLVDYFRNYDDLSCTRFIGLDQQDLAILAFRGHTQWNFNGDGHHVLKVKYAGDPVPFPVGTVECAELTGTTWGAPVSLGWQSMTSPAVTSYKGKLYVAFVRPGDKRVMWTRRDAGGWRVPEPVGSDNSLFPPAMVAGPGGGTLFYAVTGLDNTLWWRTFTESGSWTAPRKFDGILSGTAPSMAAFSNRVWLTHVGTNEKLYLNTHDGNAWSRTYPNNLDWITANPIAMAAYSNHVWRAARGTDEGVYVSASNGNGTWWQYNNTAWKVTRGLALATHNNKMWIFLRDMDGYLRAATRSGDTYSSTHYVSGTRAIRLMGEPAAASHNGKLYAMYRR
ncbi:hypothetical protein [Streptomyces sp. NPDC054787]